MQKEPASFADLDVLVVEDEAIISFLVEDMLRELGARDVWIASSVETALAKLKEKRPGLAILDVNLGGVSAYPVAERLEAAGIPFLFASGYGQAGIGPAWSTIPVIQKPFDMDGLTAGLMRALARQ
jgi:DNA-binding response OmpR family regulator